MKEIKLGEVYTEEEARELVGTLASSTRLVRTFGFTADKYPYFRVGEYHFFGTQSLHNVDHSHNHEYQLISVPGESLTKESDFQIFVPKAKGDRGANYYKRYNLNKVNSVVDRPEFNTEKRQTMSSSQKKRFSGLKH